MKLLKVKTARFAAVVEKCGRPQRYTLWRKPKNDTTLRRLVETGRIMTVHAQNGGTEFGEVGFYQRVGASHLAFPKSLKRFEGKRIIGIKWDLVES